MLSAFYAVRPLTIAIALCVRNQATGLFYKSGELTLTTHEFHFDPTTGEGRMEDRGKVRPCLTATDNCAVAYIDIDGERFWDNAALADDMRADDERRAQQIRESAAYAERLLAKLNAA